MRRRAVRVTGWLVLLGVVWTVMAPDVFGAAVRRTWHAALGEGAAGSVELILMTDYSGSLTVTASGLRPSSRYGAMIYQGTCGRPTEVLGLAALAIDATGAGSRSVRFGRAAGIRLWTHAAQGGIAFRLANGPEGHCGLLTSPVATRLWIPRFGIDLPVVLQPGQAFPLCNVAMYLPAFSQPGEAGPTFLYAHARTGMFLPLLQASWLKNGRTMIGMPVTVWTTDDRVVTYRVTRVLRHVYRVPDYDPSQAQLWLQTSEGPYGTYNKLFVTAMPVSEHVASYADAHPTPHPVVCGHYH